ncbi:Spo0B C-terminal domain-containing protein [Bacillus sp. FJAT-27231]|uniref:Spo0B C-terminal domain-containing protein n=1 Tax=Bacillus sp. FJAT-27231 TaxID=1679168 RepID=UPI000670980E|nr:Spo0B C-terminal domain-containing protein [Bacillus sp. FJAT-27231]
MDEKSNNWTIIRALQHARHDWMNHIQLIKGYIALGKTEEAERVIEQTVMQAKQEAHLCNLALPELAKLLITFNWEAHAFQLEYEVMDMSIKTGAADGCLVSWMSSLFCLIERNVETYAANHLYLSMEEAEEGIRFFFEFSGIITNTEALSKGLVEILSASGVKRYKIHLHSSEEMLFEAVI